MLRLLLISLSFALSLFIFQNGFLLKRQELHLQSNCSDAKLDRSSCWMPRQQSRIVLLIVDALRYDFIEPSEDGEITNYRGQMSGIAQLIKQGAAFGKVEADPPTTTLQRVKAFTTGTLPTFIDAGDNFSPDATVLEDNWLDQAKSNGLNVTFFGDDTWLSLFPKSFTAYRGFSSFDINDLTTVDFNVRELMLRELSSNGSFDMIVGHILGVDHCGHKFGPTHPMMRNTLRRTDEFISEIARRLVPDDLLIVMGDHGMTSTGDHGGDSDDEISAAILAYSPGRQLPAFAPTTRQIDIVPTLSLLLGIPIPFSSLGSVMLPLFNDELHDEAVLLNYEQIVRFAKTYGTVHSFAELFTVTSHDALTTDDQLEVIRNIQRILRSAWTKFDWPLMRTGLFSLAEVSIYALSAPTLDGPWVIVRTGYLLLQLSCLMGGVNENPAVVMLMIAQPLSALYSVGNLFFTHFPFLNYPPSLYLAVCGVIFHALCFLSNSFIVYEADVLRYVIQGILIISTFERMKETNNGRMFIREALLRKTSLSNAVKMLISQITSYNGLRLFVGLTIIRTEVLFHRCREEQQNCETYFPVQLSGLLSADTMFLRSVTSILSLVALNVAVRRHVSDHLHSSLRVVWALSRLANFLIVSHQMILIAMMSGSNENYQLVANSIALAVYACSLVSIAICLIHRRSMRPSDLHISTSYSVIWSILILFGDGLTPAVVLFIVLLLISYQLMDKETLPWMASILIQFGFYFTGHSPTIPAIPWQAAFVGVPGNFLFKVVPGFLVFTHLFAATILVVVMLPLHPSFSAKSFQVLVASSSIRAFLVSLAAFIHRRHLMVWKIFAPKFIFEGVNFIVLLVLANICLFLCKRVSKTHLSNAV